MNNDGGPAFPAEYLNNRVLSVKTKGMSLRDWFAGQFIAGRRGPIEKWDETAKDAYRLADAMIAEREK